MWLEHLARICGGIASRIMISNYQSSVASRKYHIIGEIRACASHLWRKPICFRNKSSYRRYMKVRDVAWPAKNKLSGRIMRIASMPARACRHRENAIKRENKWLVEIWKWKRKLKSRMGKINLTMYVNGYVRLPEKYINYISINIESYRH